MRSIFFSHWKTLDWGNNRRISKPLWKYSWKNWAPIEQPLRSTKCSITYLMTDMIPTPCKFQSLVLDSTPTLTYTVTKSNKASTTKSGSRLSESTQILKPKNETPKTISSTVSPHLSISSQTKSWPISLSHLPTAVYVRQTSLKLSLRESTLKVLWKRAIRRRISCSFITVWSSSCLIWTCKTIKHSMRPWPAAKTSTAVLLMNLWLHWAQAKTFSCSRAFLLTKWRKRCPQPKWSWTSLRL